MIHASIWALSVVMAGLALMLGQAQAGPTVAADVIIIGAGMSGLSAARSLVDAGVKKVIVLEGQDKAGGRTTTLTTKSGIKVDLGAGWIHGSSANHPTTQLASKYGLTSQLFETPNDSGTIFGSDNRELSDATNGRFEALGEKFTSWLEDARDGDSLTVKSSVKDALSMWLPGQKLSVGDEQGLRQVLSSDIELEYAASLGNLSALYYDDDEAYSGKEMMWRGGYVMLAEALVKGLDVRYSQTVTKVDYSTKTVKVSTAGGTTFTAPYVISTLPLGVLQRGKVAFSPALPAAKATCIKSLGMGVLDKVVMVFPRDFWSEDAPGVWINRVASPPGTWSEFLSLNIKGGVGAPVLVGLFAGDFAWGQEARTDAAIKADVLAVLRGLFGSGNVPEPSEFYVVRWGANPWSYGSYPFTRAGAASNCYSRLSTSLNNRVFFAGDATHPEYAGTVHGAILSGRREATAILKLLKAGSGRRRLQL